MNKDPEKLWGEGFNFKEPLYKYTCSLVFENAKPYLRQAIIVIDKSGRKEFRSQLQRYLQKKVNIDSTAIKKVKSQRSRSNNLLQLADYIAGVINRVAQGKPRAQEYHRLIAHREIYVQMWPK